MALEGMSAAELMALSKVLAKMADARRKDLAPGEYPVAAKVTLDVAGTVKVGADVDYTPTVAIPMKAAFALFVRYSGVTGPAAMDALTKAMSEALAFADLADDEKDAKIAAINEVADLDKAEEVVRAGLAALPKKTRKGSVTTAGVKVSLGTIVKVGEDVVAEVEAA